MKRSRMLSAVLAVIMLVSVMPMSAFASSTSGTEGCLSYKIVGEEVTITDCDESVTGEVVIPETIEGLPVTSIKYNAFEGCTSLTSVNIPKSVESIEEIKLPKSITYIDFSAFPSFYYYDYDLEIIYYNGSESEWNAIDKRHVFPDDIQVIYNYIGLSLDDIKVDATQSEIDQDVELVVDSIGDMNGIEDAITNSNSNYVVNDYMLYDISLVKDNQKVQPDGDVTVSIRVPDELKGTDCKVFFIDDSGNATDMNAVYKNGYMVFVTNHFSYYVVAEVEEQQNSEEPNEPENPEETKGQWLKDNIGWWYKNADGSYPYKQFQEIDGVIYYFNTSGYMVTGWQLIGGTWYYFNGSGAMVANQWIGNYYLQADGSMATNKWIGNYYVDANGVWVPGKTR